ncbi:phytanoyl-CoA dioxygenase [Notoacmeibacter marinus]|uniref:Phytanoyl-CoA dioxygenase n=2 Tax=Notoacmeibacter marinus TaxID=1876515 RepID=A0A231V486_9HYPH|nr:phytanoyl-CoA dioxygenase [Notoacmeibacter marinus]
MAVKNYGVKHRTPPGDVVDRALEQLKLVGYAVVDSGYDAEEQAEIAAAFDRAHAAQAERYGADALREIDEHNTVRMPMLYEAIFGKLAQNPRVLAITEHLIGGSYSTGTFILNQQNGIVNPAGKDYNQAAYHRDLPYQHFTSSRPLALNALYCVDPFTSENGATLVVPGTHKSEPFPSDDTVRALERQITASAGSFLVLDCMVYHSGAPNRSTADRRAVNHVYTIPMIRQQIDMPAILGHRDDLSDDARKLFGYGAQHITSLDAYYASRRSRLEG